MCNFGGNPIPCLFVHIELMEAIYDTIFLVTVLLMYNIVINIRRKIWFGTCLLSFSDPYDFPFSIEFLPHTRLELETTI